MAGEDIGEDWKGLDEEDETNGDRNLADLFYERLGDEIMLDNFNLSLLPSSDLFSFEGGKLTIYAAYEFAAKKINDRFTKVLTSIGRELIGNDFEFHVIEDRARYEKIIPKKETGTRESKIRKKQEEFSIYLSQAKIPRPEVTFDNMLEHPGNSSTFSKSKEIIRDFIKGRLTKGYLITGVNASGKTSLISAMANSLAAKGVLPGYFSVDDWVSFVKSSQGKYPDVTYMRRADVSFVDGIEALAAPNRKATREITYDIVDRASREGKGLVCCFRSHDLPYPRFINLLKSYGGLRDVDLASRLEGLTLLPLWTLKGKKREEAITEWLSNSLGKISDEKYSIELAKELNKILPRNSSMRAIKGLVDTASERVIDYAGDISPPDVIGELREVYGSMAWIDPSEIPIKDILLSVEEISGVPEIEFLGGGKIQGTSALARGLTAFILSYSGRSNKTIMENLGMTNGYLKKDLSLFERKKSAYPGLFDDFINYSQIEDTVERTNEARELRDKIFGD